MSAKTPLPVRILIPVANPMTAEELIKLGAAMVDPRAGELSALGIVEVPEGMPLSEGATRARHARRLLQRVLDYAPDGTAIHPIVRIGRHAAEGIVEAAAEQEADLIIFGWGGRAVGGRDGNGPTVFSPTIDEVVRESPCDIAVVKQRGSKEIRRVLVPVRGGPHAELALRFADAVARHHDATVVVLHLVPPGITLAVRAQAERALAAFIKQHISGRSEAVLREAPNVRNAILREAERSDLVVMGASAQPAGADGETYLFGSLPEAIAARARSSVMVVKTRETIERTTFDQLAARAETLAAADRAAEEARAVPVRVERWFGESNFHHAEFSDLRRLVTLKEKQKLTISLVLPTLNEEETIGPIVRRAMREMVGRVPLLDEVLVIDSASTDRTREIAEAEGARVVQHPDILPRYGSFTGKGEALWKSLYETTGDIVVWADTDVKNWHQRMVYGTLGPLLHEPRLQYVKGYYQRPIVEHGVLTEGGGGRVTELVARPLINLFYPELSGMIQPLAGEYAGRRGAPRVDPVLHRLRGRDRAPDRRHRAARHRRARPGRPRTPDPSQPGARGTVTDVVRHPPGRHEAARGAAQDPAVRRDGLDHEAAAVGPRTAVARGHRAGRPGTPADGADPGIPRATPARRSPGAGRTGSGTGGCARGAAPTHPWVIKTAVGTPTTVLIAPDSFKGSLTSVEVATGAGRRMDPGATGRRDPQRPVGRRRRGHDPCHRIRRRLGLGRDHRAPTSGCARSARPGCARRRRTTPMSSWPRHPGCRWSSPDERRSRRCGDPRHRRASFARPGRGHPADHPRDRRQRHDRRRPGMLEPSAWWTTGGAVDLTGLDAASRRGRAAGRVRRHNPLLGPSGAAATYGPQKGATPAHVAELDARIAALGGPPRGGRRAS